MTPERFSFESIRAVVTEGVQVRPTEDRDRRAVALLYAEVGEERVWIGAEPPVDVEARAASWVVEGDFVAEASGEIVGSLHVQPSKHGYSEIGMAVQSDWRGRGIGTALMVAALDWARDQGLHKLTLGVFAHNEPAIALYRKFGFVEEGRRVKHYRRQSGEIWDGIDMGRLL